jgi:hypothetical protein
MKETEKQLYAPNRMAAERRKRDLLDAQIRRNPERFKRLNKSRKLR